MADMSNMKRDRIEGPAGPPGEAVKDEHETWKVAIGFDVRCDGEPVALVASHPKGGFASGDPTPEQRAGIERARRRLEWIVEVPQTRRQRDALLAACRFALEVLDRQSKFYIGDAVLARLAADIEAAVALCESPATSEGHGDA